MHRWDPFKDSFRIIERFGTRFRGVLEDREGEDGETATPAADIFQDIEGLTFAVELPGVAPAQLAIHVCGGTLVVEAERPFARTNNKAVVTLEGRYGRMRRTFVLPPTADLSHTVAELRNGVLRVFVPCRAETATVTARLDFGADDEARPVPVG